LPRVFSHGRVVFRHVKCPHRKEDAIQEMAALAWLYHLRLAAKGKDGTQFPIILATFTARQVRSGRKACAGKTSKDVLSPTAQARHGFDVEPIPSSTRTSGPQLHHPGPQAGPERVPSHRPQPAGAGPP